MPGPRAEPKDSSTLEVFNRRLPLYAYLEPLLLGRRVLEVGSGDGSGADYLASRGASLVVAVESDPALVERARARFRRPNLELRSLPSLVDLEALGERFDVVLVTEAERLVRHSGAVVGWRRALVDTARGHLVVAVASADRALAAPAAAAAMAARDLGDSAGGVGYYELADLLSPHFPRVQMFGMTPFAGVGMVEFDGGGDELRVESRLIQATAEPPAPFVYAAIAGTARAEGLGYALVQVPFAPIEARLVARAASDDRSAEARLGAMDRRLDDVERRARARVDEADGRVTELRRKLDDASHQAEQAIRVARAQGEEIEELRGRLRRAAEDRGALDNEIAKLRRALAEADESVMSLTRRTAEEMSAVAERLVTGLRATGPAPVEVERRARGGPDLDHAREELDRLRVVLAETEARAGAAERRLEELGTDSRERQGALVEAQERLRLAEDGIARERREVSRMQGELRAATARVRVLEESEDALTARDERIARLEGEKQDLVWRLAELEEKLRDTIARAVVADGARAPSDELASARAARDRALEEFHRVASTHVDEVTNLRASVAEQSALVAELEDAVATAEARAESATTEAASLRKNAKTLEEADRTRRSRLAELEGKLLRLEHERRAAASAPAPTASEEQERRVAELTRDRDGLRVELDRVGHAGRERIAALEAETARLGAAVEAAARARVGNGHGGGVVAIARELEAVEAGIGQGLAALADIEEVLGRMPEAVPIGHGNGGTVALAEGQEPGELALLHATLASYRRSAARLRDELDGVRRRWESLSPSEISGYLEELGEDLAEMEK
jgi:hypothetical protein